LSNHSCINFSNPSFFNLGGDLYLSYLVAGFVCQPNHQDHFPEENFAAKTEERLVHQRADAALLGMEFVVFLDPRL